MSSLSRLLGQARLRSTKKRTKKRMIRTEVRLQAMKHAGEKAVVRPITERGRHLSSSRRDR